MLFTLDSTSNLDKRTQNRQNSRPSRIVESFLRILPLSAQAHQAIVVCAAQRIPLWLRSSAG